MKNFVKNHIWRLVLLLIFIFIKVTAQTCGGTFGNPIFTEDFGSINTPLQTISPPLVAPASTNYQYVSKYPPDDGQYTISNQTEWVPWNFLKSSDHSYNPSGTYGNMLVVNASYNPGEFYRRRVSNLCPNQFYQFSAWILNLHSSGSNIIKPNVTFQIRSITGTVIRSVSSGDIAEDSSWKNFSIDFKSDIISTAVDVVLINNSPGGNGNDLAIDDITFSPCGPSTSISADLPNVFTTGVCDNSQAFQLSANLNTNTFLNVNYIWQKSSDYGSSWQDLSVSTSNPTINIAAGTYQNGNQFRFIVGEAANILSANCQVISEPIILKINGYPAAPIINSPLNYCQNSSSTALTATGANLLWYSSATGGTGSLVAPVPNTSVSGTFSFFVSQTTSGCESPRSEIKINVGKKLTAPIVNSPLSYCQNKIAAPFTVSGSDLLWYTTATGGTGSVTALIPNTSVEGTFSFWVSQSSNGCESFRSEIIVNILPEPHSSKLNDTTICKGQTITLDAGSGFKSYEWNTTPPTFSQTLEVSSVGNYSIILTGNNDCTAIQTVNVTSGITPTIVNIISTDNSIEIIASGGNPPYFYSIDNQKTWQTSNIFTNLKAEIYTVFVKSQLNSCSISQETAVIFIPNVFTPNDDSLNDIFKIKNLEYFPNAKLNIFDRYGKVVFVSKDINKFTWDGTFLGRILPTGTYWYMLDFGNNYKKTGWILLKNRN